MGNETNWYYNALNQVIEEKNEYDQSRYFAYDSAGNLVEKQDRNDRVTIYERDRLGRVVAEEWWDGTRPSASVGADTEGSRADELQYLVLSSGTPMVSGTFTLTFDGQTTSAIAWDADAATVAAALEALSNIGDGDVEVTQPVVWSSYQEWDVTFVGALAGTDVAQITIDGSGVTTGSGAPSESNLTQVQGFTTNEVQSLTFFHTTGGTFTLSFGGTHTDPIDWDASAGELDSAIESLSGAGTVSVTGSAGGPYTIEFTGDYGGQNIALLQYRANDLTNGELLRTIAYSYNAGNELLEVSDPDATYEYLYDGLGRTTNFVQNITGLTPEIEFVSQYNAASRREHLQAILDGDEDFQNTYTYDNLHRLSLMVQESGSDNVVAPKRFEFTYNALSQFERIDRYASTDQSEFVASSHYSYDDLNRLKKLVHAETTTAPTSGWGSDPLAGYAFGYDDASRIVSIDSMLDGLSEYTHDDTNQLVGADHNTATDEAYEYDANGNRIMSGYDIDPNNQLYSDGTYNYLYDDEGNRETRTRISDGYVTRYEWDHRNRLTKIIEEDDSLNELQVTVNTYDAFNQWIARSFDDDGDGGNPFVDTFFAYESGQIVFQFDGSTASDLTHRYTWGEQVDHFFSDEAVTSLGSAGDVLWGFGDHLNTQRDLVTYDDSGDDAAIANHREYNSYGVRGNESNGTVDMLFGFTARAFDEVNNAQNNGMRWYEARNAIWLNIGPNTFAASDRNLVS